MAPTRTVVLADPLLTRPEELAGVAALCAREGAEAVVFLNAFQAEGLRQAGCPRVRVLGADWSSAERYAFLRDVYALLLEAERRPEAWITPWPERFALPLNLASLLRYRMERGASLFFLVGFHLALHAGEWRGVRAVAASGPSRFGEFVRFHLGRLGAASVEEARVEGVRDAPAPAGRRARVLGGGRQLAADLAGLAANALPHRGAPFVHVEPHRATAEVAGVLERSGRFRVMPYASRELLSLGMRLRRRRAAPRIRAAVNVGVDALRAAGTTMPAPWPALREAFLDFYRGETHALVADAFSMWWRLDRYRPRCALRVNSFTHVDHAVRVWCRARGVPFAVMQHGEPSPIGAQLQTAFDAADHVFCWDALSREAFLNGAPADGREVVVTGNPQYGAAGPGAPPPGALEGVLVAFTTYGPLFADAEARSWQAIHALAARFPGVRWSIRQHPTAVMRSYVENLFAGSGVRVSGREESFREACRDAQVVVTNLSSVRSDALALGRAVIVWNDLGIPDLFNGRPGARVAATAEELAAELEALLRDPLGPRRLAGEQAPGAERQPAPPAERVAERIGEIAARG